MISYDKNIYSIDDVEMMVMDFIADSPEMDDLSTIGAPYYDENLGVWCQDAEDEKCVYTLWADSEGMVYIAYDGAK